jgi:hypothetical protein
MNVADEEHWRKQGLFDLVDSVGKDYTSSDKSPSLPSLPSHFRSSPCTPCAPSFSKLLQSTSGYTTKPFSKGTKKKHCQHFQSQVGTKPDLNSLPGRGIWRPKKIVHKMALGSDVGLPESCNLALCGLVGRLSYNYLCKVSILDWVDLSWKPLLGYAPEVIFLTKGWMGFLCKSPENVNVLLSHKWIITGSNLMIKRWCLAFNPESEYFHFRHLWILLPGLPLQS